VSIRVVLKKGRERALLGRHPWVFSGAVARVEGAGSQPVERPVAQVAAHDGRPLGAGLYSAGSRIPVRMLQFGDVPLSAIGTPLFAERLAAAMRLRESLLPPRTTGYRLLNAEGDGVPGWTVDRFGETLVSQITCGGLEAIRAEAYAALAAALPQAAIVQKNSSAGRRVEGLSEVDEVIAGAPPDEAPFEESGLQFSAEIAGGQKTGFYCDQRDNRRLVERLAPGRAVLDLFAHSGAFGLYALRGGARRVVHVESAARLIERGREQYQRNAQALAAAEALPVEWIAADVFEHLRQGSERFDLVICDPPPLARKQRDRERAARAYKDLNRLAMARLAPGGLLLTFSCSAAVDAKLFRQILFAAALESEVDLQLLRPLSAAIDHPVAITHPEGEYLKGWLAINAREIP
jgi:23S rRNA (cytosine1962-C5)-methyltransferase